LPRLTCMRVGPVSLAVAVPASVWRAPPRCFPRQQSPRTEATNAMITQQVSNLTRTRPWSTHLLGQFSVTGWLRLHPCLRARPPRHALADSPLRSITHAHTALQPLLLRPAAGTSPLTTTTTLTQPGSLPPHTPHPLRFPPHLMTSQLGSSITHIRTHTHTRIHTHTHTHTNTALAWPASVTPAVLPGPHPLGLS
jgi:hypothetical protein